MTETPAQPGTAGTGGQFLHWKRDLLTIISGQAVSLIGSAAVQFTLIWWLAAKTGSPIVMALAGLAAFIPQVVLGPFAGVWIDRLKRKYVIIAADMFTGVAAVVFAFFFIDSTPPYWSVALVLGARAVANVFQTPAMQASVPMIVPQEELVRANGWAQFLQSGSFMLGPVIGAALYAAFPMPVILLTDLIGAIVASVAVILVKIPDPPQGERHRQHFFHEMKEGALIFLRDRRLSIVTFASTIAMMFMMPLATFYPLMTSSYFALNAWHASVVEFLFAAGMMIAAAVLSAIGHIKHKFFVIHLGLFGFGLTAFISGLFPPTIAFFWIFALLCGLMGASQNVYNIPYIAYMQEALPPESMGRVFSLVGSLMSISMPIGLIFAGPAAEARGVPFWFVVSGAVTMGVMVVSYVIVSVYAKRNGLHDDAPEPAAASATAPLFDIREATTGDFSAILALNKKWEHVTSPLTEKSLDDLYGQAAYRKVACVDGEPIAFLLAVREGQIYASPNYRWFAEGDERRDRDQQFLYIDRVIVEREHQGTGIARALYEDVFAFARHERVTRVVCELDIEPPNEPSRAFHDAHGFKEVGRQRIAGGSKEVSLRERDLPRG